MAIIKLPGEIDHTPLCFGRYNGKTPDEVSNIDPGYLIWMSEQDNLKHYVSAALVRACKQDMAEGGDEYFSDPDTYQSF